jgi:hypothetical protein
MDEYRARNIRGVLLFLTELRQKGYSCDSRPELDNLIQGDALSDSPIDIFLRKIESGMLGGEAHPDNKTPSGSERDGGSPPPIKRGDES